MTIEDRFWSHVDKRDDNECWEWKASLDGKGYGQININGKMFRAHRVSYELTNGKIGIGLYACHKCDNRKCVNPNHIFLGTPLDNMRDMISKGRDRHKGVHPRGENCKSSKLKEENVKFIKQNCHMRGIDLAKMFSVRPSTISEIRAGRSWRHV